MTDAILAMTPSDREFAAALDEAIRQTAEDIAAARNEVLSGTVALAFELQSEGAKIDAAAFIKLADDVRKELIVMNATRSTDTLVKALTRVAQRVRGDFVLPASVESELPKPKKPTRANAAR